MNALQLEPTQISQFFNLLQSVRAAWRTYDLEIERIICCPASSAIEVMVMGIRKRALFVRNLFLESKTTQSSREHLYLIFIYFAETVFKLRVQRLILILGFATGMLS
jgi:hypothetical protein